MAHVNEDCYERQYDEDNDRNGDGQTDLRRRPIGSRATCTGMGAFGTMIYRNLTILSAEFRRAYAFPLPGTGTSVETFFLAFSRRLAQIALEAFQAFTGRVFVARIRDTGAAVLTPARRILTSMSSERR